MGAEKNARRSTMLRVADALEDLMTETGKGETVIDRKVWATCHPLWVLIQKLLREEGAKQ